MKKTRKTKKIKTKPLVAETPKRKRGRPRKDATAVVAVAQKKRGRPRKEEQRLGTPKSHEKIEKEMLEQTEIPKRKRGRPRKGEVVAVAPKKRGRKPKVETKEEKLHNVAKLGKRNYKKAVENMAMEKISKRMRRKGAVGNGNGDTHGEPVSVKTYSYETQSRVLASSNIAPEGVKSTAKKIVKDEMPILPIEEKIKKRLTERGYVWKADTFKIVEKTPTYWAVEFTDKKQGEIMSYSNVVEEKKLEDIERSRNGKTPKLSKVELNRYIKKMVARGLHPKNIKVIENTPEFFRIEFNDGDSESVVIAGHVKGWEDV